MEFKLMPETHPFLYFIMKLNKILIIYVPYLVISIILFLGIGYVNHSTLKSAFFYFRNSYL